jgi:hypothetical protein
MEKERRKSSAEGGGEVKGRVLSRDGLELGLRLGFMFIGVMLGEGEEDFGIYLSLSLYLLSPSSLSAPE